jgi:hypothetical protein
MSIVAAALNLAAFLGHNTAKPIVQALGRFGARAFYRHSVGASRPVRTRRAGQASAYNDHDWVL